MEDQKPKPSRKRVANFTAEEKALLAHLIKNTPIVESKLTDGKTIAKKQEAWVLITSEFNSNANVHKRETIVLKRAWDNMKQSKAKAKRKARAIERGSLLRTGGGSPEPPPSPHHEAIITMVEEAGAACEVIICEDKNEFDSDGTVLSDINTQEKLETNKIQKIENLENIDIEELQNGTDQHIFNTEHVRRPTDYIRREAVLRLKHFENKKRIEMQILKTQLEVEQLKKNAALLEEERQKTLLEQARIELQELKKSLRRKEGEEDHH